MALLRRFEGRFFFGWLPQKFCVSFLGGWCCFCCCQGGFSVSASLEERTSNFGTFHDGRRLKNGKMDGLNYMNSHCWEILLKDFTVLFTTREFLGRKKKLYIKWPDYSVSSILLVGGYSEITKTSCHHLIVMSDLQQRFLTQEHTNHLNLCCWNRKKITISTTIWFFFEPPKNNYESPPPQKLQEEKHVHPRTKLLRTFHTNQIFHSKISESVTQVTQDPPHQPTRPTNQPTRPTNHHQPDQGSGWKGSKWLDMSPSPNHTRPDLPMERWRMGWSGSILRGRNFTDPSDRRGFLVHREFFGPKQTRNGCFCLLFGGGWFFFDMFCWS